MTELEVASIGNFLAERRDDIAGLLIELAELESPSQAPESQRPVQGLLTRRLEAIGFAAQLFPGRKRAATSTCPPMGQGVPPRGRRSSFC